MAGVIRPPAPPGTRDVADVGTAERLVERWPTMRPFVLVGAACVVGGGLVAAVTRPLGFALGSWLAAFLVLVGGVAQLALGAGQAWWCDHRPSKRRVVVEASTWDAGVAATIAGSLLAAPALTTVGGVATAAALIAFLDAMRSSTGPRWALLAYRAVLVLVLVSTPVGLVLAWTRHA